MVPCVNNTMQMCSVHINVNATMDMITLYYIYTFLFDYTKYKIVANKTKVSWRFPWCSISAPLYLFSVRSSLLKKPDTASIWKQPPLHCGCPRMTLKLKRCWSFWKRKSVFSILGYYSGSQMVPCSSVLSFPEPCPVLIKDQRWSPRSSPCCQGQGEVVFFFLLLWTPGQPV